MEQQPTHSFTFIVGYRHSSQRLNTLRRVIDWINCFQGVDFILVEQDTHSKISHLNLRCHHIFLKTNQPYNKSWSFNVALKYAKTNVIVFSDSDLIMEPNQFIQSLKLLEQYDMVNPYKSVIDLDPQESSLPFERMMLIDRPGRGETDHQKVPICGGICIFRKDAILKIGGWDENYQGWGCEDDFVSHKVKSFLNWVESPNRCYHLYHNRPQPDMRTYQKNLQLLNQMVVLSKEDLIKVINRGLMKNAMKNKYDT